MPPLLVLNGEVFAGLEQCSLPVDAGVNLRELTERMGHSTTRAALIYLHGGDQLQRTIADAVSDMARTALGTEPDQAAGSS